VLIFVACGFQTFFLVRNYIVPLKPTLVRGLILLGVVAAINVGLALLIKLYFIR